MVTSRSSMELNTQIQLTFLRGDSHASRFQLPDQEKEGTMTAISGLKCLGLLERFGRATLWQKMFLDCLVKRGDWYSRQCVVKWRLKGTKYNRLIFQLAPSRLNTVESEFGLLDVYPTPASFDRVGLKKFRKDSNLLEGGRHSVSLTHYIAMIHGDTIPVNPSLVESLMGYPIGWTELNH